MTVEPRLSSFLIDHVCKNLKRPGVSGVSGVSDRFTGAMEFIGMKNSVVPEFQIPSLQNTIVSAANIYESLGRSDFGRFVMKTYGLLPQLAGSEKIQGSGSFHPQVFFKFPDWIFTIFHPFSRFSSHFHMVEVRKHQGKELSSHVSEEGTLEAHSTI